MESHLLGLYSKDLGMTWMDWEALMGPPKGCGRPHLGLHLGAPLVPWFHSYALEEGLHSCAFWVFVLNYPTPWDFL